MLWFLRVFLLAIVLYTALPAPARAQTDGAAGSYTIQVGSHRNLEAARQQAENVAAIVPLPVRIEKIDRNFIVRAGKANQRSDLLTALEAIRKGGHPLAALRSAPYRKDRVVLELDPHAGGKGGQPHLLILRQREQPWTGLVVAPPGAEGAREASTLQPQPVLSEARQTTNRAWAKFRRGDYTAAMEQFEAAGRYDETALEARLGQAYCHIRLKEEDKAIALLEDLANRGYRPKETLPVLAGLMIERRDDDGAQKYISMMAVEERGKWQERAKEDRARREFSQAIDEKNVQSVLGLAEKNESRLEGCLWGDLFYSAAGVLAEKGKAGDAVRLYRALLDACPGQEDLRLGVLYGLKPHLKPAEIQGLVDRESQKAQTVDYRQKLSALRLDLLKERLAAAKPPEAAAVAGKILEQEPGNPDALNVLAWDAYRQGRYGSSLALFSGLRERFPENGTYAEGQIFSLLKLGRDEEALRLAQGGAVSPDLAAKVRTETNLRRANEAFRAGRYPEAEGYLAQALRFDPHNRDARSLQAWTLYHQGKLDEAMPLLVEDYREKKDPKTAGAILYGYDRVGREGEALAFARQLGESPEPSSRKTAGTYFHDRGMPLSASQADSDPGTCYFGSDKPSLHASAFYRYHDGTSGFSELRELSLPLSFVYPFRWGNSLELAVVPRHLSSGDAPSFPGQMHEIATSLWVVSPMLRYDREGPVHLEIKLGTTPLGGAVEPLPVFYADLRGGNWRFNAHSCAVEETILSYVGLDDPYSDESWGRVVRSGVEGELTFVPAPQWWLTFSAGYDYYWGKNVWENQAVSGTVSFGKTFPQEILGSPVDVSAGLFASARHFENNTNFFTPGHGGYFSPQEFFMIGPTLRVTSQPCRTFFVCLEGAVGYQYHRSEESPFFPKGPKTDPRYGNLTQYLAGSSDPNGRYAEDDYSGLGGGVRLKGVKLITSNLALSGFAAYNNASDYNEWIVGLGIDLYFDPVAKLVKPKEPCGPSSCRWW